MLSIKIHPVSTWISKRLEDLKEITSSVNVKTLEKGSGIHSITTVSKVSVRAGGSITVPCLYESKYINNVKYLCQGFTWYSCSYKIKTNKPSSSGKFSISDDKKQRVFTVTINDLTEEDTGDYWCAVEINGGSDSERYFHLSVTGGKPYLYVDEQKRTGFRGEEITIDYHYHNVGDIKWCRLGSSCVTWPNGSLDNSTVTITVINSKVLSVNMSGLRTESSGWYLCVKGDLQMPVQITVTEKQRNLESFIIPLSLLIFIVMSNAEVKYSTVKKKRKTGQLGLAEEEVTYSDVKHMRRASEKQKSKVKLLNRSDRVRLFFLPQWSEANRDVDVMYSSVVAVEHQTKQRVCFHLNVVFYGIHSITTVSKVSVRAGGSITIPCLYESKYINNVKYLCQGYYWNSCSDKVRTNKPSSSGKCSISDDKKQRVFTVTINDLTEEDTGDYWCAVEINGGYDSGTYFHLSVNKGPPHLYVDEQKRTGFRGEEITIDYHYHNIGEITIDYYHHNIGDIKWCRLGSSCVTWPDGSLDNSTVTMKSVLGVLTVTLSGLRKESSGWYWCVKGDLQMPVHITVTEKPTT
ncbi:hypothetical protein F7725_023973, partial [Dissostichus mawsoni]